MIRQPPRSTLFPYTTLSRPRHAARNACRPLEHVPKTPTFLLEIGSDLSSRRDPSASPMTLSSATPPEPRTFAATSSGLPWRSEEHTSELQSQSNLVCRLLLE